MVDKAVIIKVKNSLNNDIINRAIDSLNNNVYRTYYPSTADKPTFQDKMLKNKFIFVMVIYEENNYEEKLKIVELLLGYGDLNNDNNIIYKMVKSITSDLVIDNFISNSEIDLKEDFKMKSYLMISHSKILIEQLELHIINPYKLLPKPPRKYKDNYRYLELDVIAQHNKDCVRIVGILDEQNDRNEFQRDRERIVNSKAFRRLVDKAQIFTSAKGDHYRTRMTHTLEVCQIARAISSALNLNTDLTEAIALAHDIGHTPFGHQGERTLDDILKNKYKIINIPKDLESNFKNELGGFKHNYHGLRVLTALEEKYSEFSGLDISIQVLEGILKHTKLKLKNCNKCINKCEQDCYDINSFINKIYVDKLHLDFKDATTLEGQVVAIADEIAQRGHDVDDAFLSRLLSEEEFLDYLKIRYMKELEIKVAKSCEEIKNSNRPLIDEESLIRARIISNIINFFIDDVLKASKDNIKEYKGNNDIEDDKIFDKPIISFTTEGKRANNYLEKIIAKKAINSSEVSKFDNNAETIILSLFKSYYSNPKLLNGDCLRKIYIDFKNSPNEDVSNNIIDFKNGDFQLVKQELLNIVRLNISRVIYFENEALTEDEEKEKRKNIEYWEKRKILIRNIVDYIAGMTDNYAVNEYNSIQHKNNI